MPRSICDRWLVRLALAGGTAAAAGGCTTKSEPPVSSEPAAAAPVPPAAPAIEAAAEPAWRAKLLEDRAARDREYKTDATSPLAGIERFSPTAIAYLAVERDALRLDAQPGPATLVTFEPADPERWTWRPASAAITATSTDGKRALSPGPIAEPTKIQVTPRYVVVAQRSAGAFVVTAFDARRAELAAFERLSYFAPDARFAVRATVDRLAKPAPLELVTNRGLQKPYVRIGTLRFELDGKRHALAAFRPAGSTGHSLFVPFRDATSGKTTYGAARFLDLEEPADPGAPLTLDFNRAYNPYCAYSPAFNCPLPPSENALAVAITAGEQVPQGH